MPAPRDASARQAIIDVVRRGILDGTYKAGERLVEDRLAQELGVSRIPVREALRGLASEGLVEIAPHRGATVAAVSRELATEMIEVRAALEGLNAGLAARRHSPDIVAALQAVLAKGNAVASRATAAELTELNGRFHDLLAQAAGNSVLGDMVRGLRDRTARLFVGMSSGRARETWEEHSGILRAVVAGDEELASLLAKRHVVNAGADALARIDEASKSAAVPTQERKPAR